MKDDQGEDWKRVLNEVMAETDTAKLAEKADELELAIFNRSQHLDGKFEDQKEKEEIKEATMKLLHVRVGKLGFPLDLTLLNNAGSEEKEQ